MPKVITKISRGDLNGSRDCAFNRANANHPYYFRASRTEENVLKEELFSKEIMAAANSSEKVQVRSFLKVRPINELLAVPLKPIEDPAKQQNVEVIKSLSKLIVESKFTETNQSKNSNLHNNVIPKPKDSNHLVDEKSLSKLTVESKVTETNQSRNSKVYDNVKSKPKASNSLPSVKEKSLSKLTVESKFTETNRSKNSKLHDNVNRPKSKASNPLPSVKEKSLSKLPVESKLAETNQSKNSKVHDNVKPKPKVSNSLPLERDKQKSYNQLPLSKDEVVLNDADVLRMDLSQELDDSLQYKENLSNKSIKQIFIGNMPPSMKILYVSKFFERYGKINHVKFIRSKNQKKVICFITYDSLLATRASMETNGLLFRGYNLRVSRVGRVRVLEDATIVVTNLPDGTSNQDLYDLFEMCGLIKSQYLVTEIGKLVAYITFELKISVSYALQLNSFILKGCRVLVYPYKDQREKLGLSNLIL